MARYFFLLIVFIGGSQVIFSQSDSISAREIILGNPDSTIEPAEAQIFINHLNIENDTIIPRYISPDQTKKRVRLVVAGNIIGYGAVMAGLYTAWYRDYEQTGFHVFNDWPEWKQVDKAGHFFSAYTESLASSELWRWTGIDRKKRIWLGGLSGIAYQTVIEILDGFSSGWGWSWADFGANILGSGALISQELAWGEQRVHFKFSFHNKKYNDPQLENRSNKLFGSSTTQRFIKDYNGQTYWASANIHSFFKQTNLPRWLSLSIGYGAEGLFGGTRNFAKDEAGNVVFNRPDIKRYRQWYLSPDVDFSKIKTNSKFLRVAFLFLNALKFPAPALEFSNGKLKGHLLYF